MQLRPNEVHIWSTNLAIHPAQEQAKHTLLSADEVARADRFHFAIHRQRYIAARAGLRQILSKYLHVLPENIGLAYSEHNKPMLLNPNHTNITFNLAHSDDLAVYAITLHHAIGIDIEKIQEKYNPGITERYFHSQEQVELGRFSAMEKTQAFYRIWSRKEALLKALGKGLTYPLQSFAVAAQDIPESIRLENEIWTLVPLAIHPDYQSALASNQAIQSLSFWKLFADGTCQHKTD